MKKSGLGFMALFAYSGMLPEIFSVPKRPRIEPRRVFIDVERIEKAKIKRQRRAEKRMIRK